MSRDPRISFPKTVVIPSTHAQQGLPVVGTPLIRLILISGSLYLKKEGVCNALDLQNCAPL